MSNKIQNTTKKSLSPDWFVRGILTKIGEVFDRLTGRHWQPSSGLATSELIERLKQLLDSEAQAGGDRRKFVPHNIKLKMQWDKFSTDAEIAVKKLENELLIAAVDHINDCRYYTYAPLKLEIKPDYFTEGVKLSASFDSFGEEKNGGEAAINVSLPDLKNVVVNQPSEIIVEPDKEFFVASFTIKNQPRTKKLEFAVRQRLSVGRTKENDLWLDDASVSKIHAALILNSEKHLVVADTGSTNGTFINDERIAYGRAFAVKAGDKLKFGSVEIALEHLVKEVAPEDIYAPENALENKNLTAKSMNFETVPSDLSDEIKPVRGEKTLLISDAAATANGAEITRNDAATKPQINLDAEK